MKKRKKESHAFSFTDNEEINRLLSKIVSEVKEFTESQLDQIKRLTQIGFALSAEKRLDRLLEMIVDEAREFTHADGGTLYIVSDDETELQFAIVQNETLNVRMGGTGGKITWPPVKLRNPDGSPNHANVSAYAALTGQVVNIADVYHAEGFNFEGTRKYDSETGYRSKSMLVIPLRNHENDIIGVLQLINARVPGTHEVIPFSMENQRMIESLASQAAISLSNNRLIQDLENLLESFVRTIAMTIDEKSPFTGGHVRRVAELTMAIAEKINSATEGPFAEVYLSEDKMKELRLSAWLHDVGKITTPEYIIDKAKKLQTLYDRIETLKMRFEILKRDYLIAILKEKLAMIGNSSYDEINGGYKEYVENLQRELDFLIQINTGRFLLDDQSIEFLRQIASRTWIMNGDPQPLINEDELQNLSIPQGTLTEKEKEIVRNHVSVTYKMLSQLPFPKKFKNIPNFASLHHERLDGKGYPFGFKDVEIPLEARIIALADIFDALTAKDRPYKKEKTISETLAIMKSMADDHYIDSKLLDLFINERIYNVIFRKENDVGESKM